MFLKEKATGTLIEVINLEDLYDPCRSEIVGRSHAGEEMQDPYTYPKLDLIFPSGESLPRCWIEPHYREMMDATPAVTVA